MSTFAIPNEKRGNKNLEFGKRSSLKRLITVQEASTEKNTIYREELIPYGIISVRTDLKYKKLLYNEEFDPGSG